MPIRDPAPLEPATDVATGRSREQHVELRDAAVTRSSAATRTSGPFTSFGSRPSPQPTPSFWNEPTTKASSGRSSAARAAARYSGVTSGNCSMSIPIGITWTALGSTPASSTSSRISSWVTWIASRSARAPSGERRTRGRTPGSPASPAVRGDTPWPRRCVDCSQRGCSASKWLVRKTAWSVANGAQPRSADVVPETSRGRFEMSRVLVHGPVVRSPTAKRRE